MYWAVHTTLCSALRLDATGQDALDGSALGLFEDNGTHAKYFQSPEGEKVLLCHLHDCLGAFGP